MLENAPKKASKNAIQLNPNLKYFGIFQNKSKVTVEPLKLGINLT